MLTVIPRDTIIDIGLKNLPPEPVMEELPDMKMHPHEREAFGQYHLTAALFHADYLVTAIKWGLAPEHAEILSHESDFARMGRLSPPPPESDE